jgi:hypothetical protein
MGSQPLLQEILPIHGAFNFRIAPHFKKGREATNGLHHQENMGEILVTRKLNLMWGILMLKPSTKLVRKTEMNVVVIKKICSLPIDYPLQNFFTTSLLLPSLVFEDSTFELKFTQK